MHCGAEALRVDGDGSMALDFTYVDDTANGIFRVATNDAAKGETISDVEVEYGDVLDHIPTRGTLDVTKARELIGFEPQYDLGRALSAYIEHLRHNPF